MSLKSLSYNLSSSQEPLQFSNYVIVVSYFHKRFQVFSWAKANLKACFYVLIQNKIMPMLTISFASASSIEQALRKFSEAARCKYLTNEDNKVTIC